MYEGSKPPLIHDIYDSPVNYILIFHGPALKERKIYVFMCVTAFHFLNSLRSPSRRSEDGGPAAGRPSHTPKAIRKERKRNHSQPNTTVNHNRPRSSRMYYTCTMLLANSVAHHLSCSSCRRHHRRGGVHGAGKERGEGEPKGGGAQGVQRGGVSGGGGLGVGGWAMGWGSQRRV